MRQNQSLKASSNLAAFVILIALSLCSCVPKNKTSTRLKVVASVPVIYDWTRSLMDESTNTRLFLNLIIKNGLNFHNLVPGETEENLIGSADLLIYTGGPSDSWIDDMVEKTSAVNSKRKVLKLADYISDNGENSLDPHCILSPSIALVCCQKITEYLCLIDPENAQSYNQFNTRYSELLSILDSSWKIQAQRAADTTLIICDRMPLKYVFEEYGFNYIALYDECPAPAEKPALRKISDFGYAIGVSDATAVYVFEDSDKKLAKQVIGNSKNPKCDTIVFDSMESLTLSQLFNGKKYIDIMQNNLTCMRLN